MQFFKTQNPKVLSFKTVLENFTRAKTQFFSALVRYVRTVSSEREMKRSKTAFPYY